MSDVDTLQTPGQSGGMDEKAPTEIGGFMLFDTYVEKQHINIAKLDPLLHNTKVAAELIPLLKHRFLDAFERIGLVSNAANFVGISEGTVYAWRAHDIEFSTHWDQIRRNKLVPQLEDAAFRRAIEGKSDHMLIFLLKAWKREVYDDKHSSAKEEPLTIQMLNASGKSLVKK